MNYIVLETRKIGEITGKFVVPSYQRGYRWGENEVKRLLEDIYSIHESEKEGIKSYCLQPIVVKKYEDHYNLVDGQQRLTTIFLIYKYMNEASNGFIDEPSFSLEYETREKSADFLNNINLGIIDENIDYWFMGNAYITISKWFEEKGPKSVMTNMNKYFDEHVKVIWYEVGEKDDEIELFTRLNIGKIPLTSAELVKSMFLSDVSSSSLGISKYEISYHWDNIEKELHNDKFWYFLTNSFNNSYSTRIDLILDLISHKNDSKDPYSTFFFFDEERKKGELHDIWKQIQMTYLIVKDWFGNHEMYHKIGYLIASEYCDLSEIYDLSIGLTKTDFIMQLDDKIRDSIRIGKNYGSLRYGNKNDERSILKLLLLFNVESVRNNGENTEWFPFEKYKYGDDSTHVGWSIEHIHAQQSEGLNRQDEWIEWIRLHKNSIDVIYSQNKNDEGLANLEKNMRDVLDRNKIDFYQFSLIQEKTIGYLSESGSTDYMHSISNLALLNCKDNSALNNSTFDVKRNVIIDLDMRGRFIPFCTKMVFLKYYTKSEVNQVHFWGAKDRELYIEEINNKLADYLEEPIIIDWEA